MFCSLIFMINLLYIYYYYFPAEIALQLFSSAASGKFMLLILFYSYLSTVQQLAQNKDWEKSSLYCMNSRRDICIYRKLSDLLIFTAFFHPKNVQQASPVIAESKHSQQCLGYNFWLYHADNFMQFYSGKYPNRLMDGLSRKLLF